MRTRFPSQKWATTWFAVLVLSVSCLSGCIDSEVDNDTNTKSATPVVADGTRSVNTDNATHEAKTKTDAAQLTEPEAKLPENGKTEDPLAGDQREPTKAEVSSWVFDGFSELLDVPEPSGLCYHPDRDTLFIVDDGDVERPAALYELDLHAEVLNSVVLGVDLEGVCYCSYDGLLYVADEADEQVYIVEPDQLEEIGSFYVSHEFNDEELIKKGGNGFEGIEYLAGADGQAGQFLLLNQEDPACIVHVDYAAIDQGDGGDVPIAQLTVLPAINLGELALDEKRNELWVIHSWMNVVEIFDATTITLKRWEVMPGCAQEAVAFDGEGRLWVGYDTGGIARYLAP